MSEVNLKLPSFLHSVRAVVDLRIGREGSYLGLRKARKDGGRADAKKVMMGNALKQL